ncbi:hypothetical protein JOC78_002251 [Bacillus ectoiniformans]|uniref:hypothetical protein n=1 Tax=Bacillus ectoiniformans TaxID=1494429 RepID=UPI00195A37FF|nr:hypothetical protein [Bacillus ectoiniformans]MBM7649298.1 hypothetical protein [Bacillus ectoiniformans]
MNEITLQMRELIRCMYRIYTNHKLQRKTYVGFYELVSCLNENGYMTNEMTVKLLNFYYVYEIYLYEREESIPYFKEYKKQADLLFKDIMHCLTSDKEQFTH